MLCDRHPHEFRIAPDCGLYTVWKNGQELWIMQIRESDGRWMNGPALLIGKTGENVNDSTTKDLSSKAPFRFHDEEL